jgi:glycosyltransferase involved in cell wall biosynthesis
MLAVIIPAYNEARHITAVITGLVQAYPHALIVVVDDCSADDTYALAKAAGATVLRHVVNRGQGAALRTGTRYALNQGARTIAHFDADGQFHAHDIARAVAVLESGEADVVFGSRFLADSRANMPRAKRYIIMPLAQLFNRGLGVRLSDPQAGFRAFTASAAARITWQHDKMAHCSEIQHVVFAQRLRVQEIPITVTYHEYGQRFSGGFKIISDILFGTFTK